MTYTEIIPGERLRPYVQCYYTFESEGTGTLEDTVFPGGPMEIIFNMGEGIWQAASETTPAVELWGKLTQPLAVRSVGANKMLGIRFFAHTAAYILQDEVSVFNDRVSDLRALLGAPVARLHQRLLETARLTDRIALIEDFLWTRLEAGVRLHHIGMIESMVHDMNEPDRMETIARRHHISSRYLQKLFLRYTGVNPKLYHKINRFQQSLQHITRDPSSLTSIAYECGYFDQAHFIRDFKQFAGITPSAYSPEAYPVGQALAQN
ncbi:helix-turn-helix domain-containing protein [Dinghuibacter silviterrae]|uniref:AraC family transcriptional regulator n=1 Tax=Dinghuibacter silviterrae TaxID=1539049 RepID=A0A4R8DVJ8_9BACT|nr:AraC family transcriptional regulator [Dinghuibacter silviterrae]TDX02056.1 AraC family transcriptional regulator [Dinghuibacter silviterrae]